MKDLFGKAILDFQTNNNPKNISTETNISESDVMEISYLFRNFNAMPKLEQIALEKSYGKVLDVGCGAGSHSLYLQNEKKLEVSAIDISVNSINACRLRGILNCRVENILDCQEQFDTILLLMNGTGIFENLNNAPKYLTKLKSLLNPKGQILIDSSDLIYMFDDDEDGGKWIPGDKYYGELEFTIRYKSETEVPFSWLYLDFDRLQNLCESMNLNCNIVANGENFDYLAQITLK